MKDTEDTNLAEAMANNFHFTAKPLIIKMDWRGTCPQCGDFYGYGYKPTECPACYETKITAQPGQLPPQSASVKPSPG